MYLKFHQNQDFPVRQVPLLVEIIASKEFTILFYYNKFHLK